MTLNAKLVLLLLALICFALATVGIQKPWFNTQAGGLLFLTMALIAA